MLEGKLFCTFNPDGTMYMSIELNDREACIAAAVDKAVSMGLDRGFAHATVVSYVDTYLSGKDSVYYADNGILYYADNWEILEFQSMPFQVSADGKTANVTYMGQTVAVQKVN